MAYRLPAKIGAKNRGLGKPAADGYVRSSSPYSGRPVVMDLDAMLAQEIEELNRDTEEDRRVKEAVIVAKRDPNKIALDGESSDDSASESGSPGNSLSKKGRGHQSESDYSYGGYYGSDDDYEDDLEKRDPELFRTTELNRQILLDEDHTTTDVSLTTKHKDTPRPPELVFSEPPMTVTAPDRISVSFSYGHCPSRPVTKSRKYLMACDFGEEGMYAMHWTIGTMLRDGDEIHLASVVNLEDDVNELSDDEKYRLWQELDRKSKALISKVRTTMEEMLLYNIKINVYTLAGQIKETLLELIHSLPLTMVVCGSRDRGALKGLLMGSVSTFLVQNSPVPVSVVRPQKKAKMNKRKMTAAQRLSQSVRNGQLKVDEVASISAPNSQYEH